MKYFLIIAGILAIAFIASQVYILQTMRNIEYQEYDVIKKDGPFEIRFYPEAVLASTTSRGTYDRLQGSQFRVLANYIFGGNEEKQKIEMTSPVVMEMQEDAMKMSFVMPSKWDLENLPVTSDDRITFEKTTPMYMAAYRFSGAANEEKIDGAKQKLIEWLEKSSLQADGHFSYLGYNPPWQVVDRRNEIIAPLKGFEQP